MSDEIVVKACKQSWDESWVRGKVNRDNCSGFFKSVAKNLNVTGVPDNVADGIVDYLKKFWLPITSACPGVEARQKARDGYLVAAGLRSDEHTPKRNQGHLAIVVDGDLYHSKYPTVWCGSTGAAQSQGTKSVGEVWNNKDRDNVGYYVCSKRL